MKYVEVEDRSWQQASQDREVSVASHGGRRGASYTPPTLPTGQYVSRGVYMGAREYARL